MYLDAIYGSFKIMRFDVNKWAKWLMNVEWNVNKLNETWKVGMLLISLLGEAIFRHIALIF